MGRDESDLWGNLVGEINFSLCRSIIANNQPVIKLKGESRLLYSQQKHYRGKGQNNMKTTHNAILLYREEDGTICETTIGEIIS
jgi:hypothetical protein